MEKRTLCSIQNFTDGECACAGKALLLKVAELVPKHHGRSKKQEAAASASGTGNATTGKSGKGGKKKR